MLGIPKGYDINQFIGIINEVRIYCNGDASCKQTNKCPKTMHGDLKRDTKNNKK